MIDFSNELDATEVQLPFERALYSATECLVPWGTDTALKIININWYRRPDLFPFPTLDGFVV